MKSSDTRLLSRREFNERCVALGSLVTLSGALALDAGLPSPQRAQRGPSSFATAPLSRRSGRALGILAREDIRQLMKKKRYARAFRSG